MPRCCHDDRADFLRPIARILRPPPSAAQLNAAAIVLWRASDVVQIELGSRCIVVENVLRARVCFAANRGARARSAAETTAPVAALRNKLDELGFLTPGPEADWTATAPPVPAYLGSDLAALSTQLGGDASAVLHARREAAVAVHGTSRLATSVAATMAAAGIGWVQLVHGGDVRAADACPGGLAPADEGRRFGIAAVDAIRRAAPGCGRDADPRRPGCRPGCPHRPGSGGLDGA